MQPFMEVPAGVRNVPLWEENCRKIHARAQDLIAGKSTLIDVALELQKLALWTHAQDDADLSIFTNVCEELVGLPIGTERQYWAKHALEREDVKIGAIVQRWSPQAKAAAHRLVEKYRWALAARQRRRRSGHVV
jgi:hypothetical protein